MPTFTTTRPSGQKTQTFDSIELNQPTTPTHPPNGCSGAWCHPVNPYLLMVSSLAWDIVFIVSLALAPTRYPLPILCGVASLLLTVATIIIVRSPKVNLSGRIKHRPDFGAWILYAAFGSLFAQLLVRLLASDKFGGNFANFDYGLKCLNNTETTTGDCKNYAFVSEFNTYGHFVQGMFSIFLSPAVHLLLGDLFGDRCCKKKESTLLGLTDLLPLGTVVYPTYNILKRALSDSPYSFAVSSFCNNGAEWAFGFLIGIHLGLVCEAIAIHRNLWNRPDFIAEQDTRPTTFLSLTTFLGEEERISNSASVVDQTEGGETRNKSISSFKRRHEFTKGRSESTTSKQALHFLDTYHNSLQTIRVVFGVILFSGTSSCFFYVCPALDMCLMCLVCFGVFWCA
tara:strand:- start:360 stop:1553 length:1194 start_codon:yes stop_codon:yes gene_type:complete